MQPRASTEVIHEQSQQKALNLAGASNPPQEKLNIIKCYNNFFIQYYIHLFILW